ncbi:Slr0723 protein [Geminocystis sp. NIES-3708]|uniref:tetratricopeptide repeat protein n=1 Tax=Geminocystis sp. NIES-3708 TaxID=1615909 RepID=UPI0005FC7EA3|nr:tetratricopeptide repeat protein [Geminocystis sp. NIES-3708]BAQ60559.1 Slr0723 protein [Geminocystis sp. NIES-3708]
MFEEVKLAIENKNYNQAKEILNQLAMDDYDNLWIKYYYSLILEREGNFQEAEANYRQIIKDSIYPDPTLIKIIRDSIERIVEIEKQIKQKKINDFKNIENGQDLAVLILESVSLIEKKILAPKLSKIMNIDNYTATLQIPTRSWRLYKTGHLGELNYWQTELSQVNIPCFCETIKNINKIVVYQVKYIIQDSEQVTILVEDKEQKEKEITFKWNNINNKVQGLIPIFELTLNFDAKGKPYRKQSILDYAQFYDLHLLSNNLILRFTDNFYKFDQGLKMIKEQKTSKEKWQILINLLTNNMPEQKLWSDFNLFGEGVIQFPEMLKQIESHINLFHREKNIWDEAFQLYSGLIFSQSLLKLNSY